MPHRNVNHSRGPVTALVVGRLLADTAFVRTWPKRVGADRALTVKKHSKVLVLGR